MTIPFELAAALTILLIAGVVIGLVILGLIFQGIFGRGSTSPAAATTSA